MLQGICKWIKRVWVNKGALIGCNAMLFPFAMPLIAWIVICQCYSALLSGISTAVGGAIVLMFLGLLPCSLIYAVGLAGAVCCYKKLFWEGDGAIRRSFAIGIKKNAPTYLLCIFIMWISVSLAVLTPTFYSYVGIALLAGAGSAVAVIQSLAIIPVMCIVIVQCAFFEDKLKYRFANAFKLYFMRPLRTVLFTVLSVLPFAVCMLLPFIAQLVFWVLFITVGVTFGITVCLVNIKNYFDFVMKRAGENCAENPYDECETEEPSTEYVKTDGGEQLICKSGGQPLT